jgi:hypothetical protein
MSAIDPPATLKIISLDASPKITVTAQFNPKEVSLDKSIPWQKQKKKGPADLEYTGGEPKTMGFELLFDGFEEGKSVEDKIKDLHSLTDATVKVDQKDEKKKRPPKVAIVWGTKGSEDSVGGGIRKFTGVIESVAVKYTMFLPSGEAVRATVNIKVKEADSLAVAKPQ